MGICALPMILCTILQKLFNKIYHKDLSWIRRTCCALGYIAILLIMLVSSPLIYNILPIILCPLLCSSAGRQKFKSVYKNAAVLPFKILWFYHLRCKRQAQRTAFEREKPRPLPLRLRRRLSQAPYCAESQLRASFFTKLPFEIRLQIYKEVIIGDGEHVHIVVHSPMRNEDGRTYTHANANAMRTGKIRGYRCDHAFDQRIYSSIGWPGPEWHLVDDAAEAEVVYAGYNTLSQSHFSINFPKNRGWGPVTLVQCCKQMYLEAIDLLYSESCSFI